MGLNTDRVPPTPSDLQGQVDESIARLATAVTRYHVESDALLMPLVATTIRMLCHETNNQIPLFAQIERSGGVVPELRDASPGDMLGFGVTFHFRWPQVVDAKVLSPLDHHTTGSLGWLKWWESNAFCLPADPVTGWQAGRISVSRRRLVTEWANRYGGAHVDARGPEQWLLELVNMDHLGYWSDDGSSAKLSWFDQPRGDGQWHPLVVPTHALAHLILARLAAEITTAYGRPAPDALAVMFPQLES